jgi:hypothetical protein
VTPSAEQVACGITHATWRSALEPTHAQFTDAEMAYMNIATTIALIDRCIGGVDWQSVRTVLLDPDRIVLPSTSARLALGDEWDELQAEVADLVGDMVARPALAPAVWAEQMCRGWWGMPGYEDQVDAFLARVVPSRWQETSEELREALISRPLDVPLEVWGEIVGGNGLGWLDQFDE